MRTHFTHILMIPVLALLLAGCMAEPSEPATVPTETHRPAENTFPAVTQPTAATEVPIIEEMQESAASEGSGNTLPYLQNIDRPDHSIYGGPSYDYGYVCTVRERGIYTIVEEATDSEGHLWGKLKSGIGWVDLTELQSEKYKNAPISANYADDHPVLQGAYHYCPSDQEYTIPIAFHAYGKLRDIRLFTIDFNPDGYFPGEVFFTLPELTEEMPLVAELAFPGDMTMYGISFVDEAEITHVYSIYISGRNGALMLEKE